jgi:hypothetical protein
VPVGVGGWGLHASILPHVRGEYDRTMPRVA